MRSRILIGLIAGTLGGFLGYLLQAVFIHYDAQVDVLTGACRPNTLTAGDYRTLAMCVGGLIGMFLGLVDGIVEGNSRKLVRGLFFGVLAGFLLGYIGLQLGSQVYGALGGSDSIRPTPGGFIFQVIARSFGWALMGLGIGAGSALSSGSPKRIWHGVIGGFLGGLLGGFVFDMLAMSAGPVQGALGQTGCHEGGGPSRAVGFTAIGGFTGFFIGLVDELMKEAWVRVLAGRNEGKDFILAKTVSILGRDERADVPLFGDLSVAQQHAAIRSDGRRHVLLDGGTPTGTLVNGQRVDSRGELLLRDGDMIQIGSHRILFREKATAKRVGVNPVDAPRSSGGPTSAPMPAHLCPFCGGVKDAAGNCQCSLGSGAGVAPGPVGGPAFTPPAGAYYDPNAGMNPNLSGGLSPTNAPGAFGMVAVGRLTGIEGQTAGQVFLLSGPNMVVGREPGRDIVIAGDSTVSRTHARIVNESGRENGIFVVYDNNSANGTYVNGVRISAQTLAPGDIVQFGSSKFRFE